MPGTALGASRNPWIQDLKASYQAKPKGSGTSEAAGAAGADTGGLKRNLLSSTSEQGCADPCRHATK